MEEVVGGINWTPDSVGCVILDTSTKHMCTSQAFHHFKLTVPRRQIEREHEQNWKQNLKRGELVEASQ